MSMMAMEDVVWDMDGYIDRSEQALYDTIQMKQSRKVLLDKFKSNPNLWSKKFATTVKIAQNPYKRGGLASTFHGLRILIQRQTLYAIENGYYQTTDGTKVVIDQNDVINSAKHTKYYTTKDISNISPNIISKYFKTKDNKNNNNNNNDNKNDENDDNDDNETKEAPKNASVGLKQKCEIDVFNTDCLDAAYSLLCDGYNPCLLNMANKDSPGGGFQSGMGAQEENLCRRTTLITALVNYIKTRDDKLDKNRKWGYPIDTFGTIYVPNVTVIRSNEHLGYEFLAKPYKISIVTAAMFNRPKYNDKFDYTKMQKPEISKKLKSVLRTASDNGHDAIVLSAWGCGAFKNPPLGQAKLWKELLFNDQEFKAKFKKIVFAIFDDHNAGKQHNPFGNYLPYIWTFNITKKRIFEYIEEIKKSQDDKDNNKNIEDIDSYKALCEIFMKISNVDGSESRDLDYMMIDSILGANPSAMNMLYCGGFKRSSDGSRLQLEKKRIEIAQNVYQQLLQYNEWKN